MPAPLRPGPPPWPDHGGQDLSGDTTPLQPHHPHPAPPGPLPRRPVHPEQGAPIRFHAEPPSQDGNPALLWVLRGLGLVAVAVISGLVWWYINDDGGPRDGAEEQGGQPHTGQFDFTPASGVPEPLRDSNCAGHAYGEVQKLFQSTPCQQLTRALYTTTTSDGRKVYTNVSVIRMATADAAAKLRDLADRNGTGNVNDLVRDGVVKVPPLKSLSGSDGYNAVQHDRNVIIVESDFDPGARSADNEKDKQQDEKLLDAICVDASLLGDQIGA